MGKFSLFLFFFMGCFLFLMCDRWNGKEKVGGVNRTQPVKSQSLAAKPGLQKQATEQYVATAKNYKISLALVNSVFRGLVAFQGYSDPNALPISEQQRMKESIISNLLNQHVLYQESLSHSVDVSDENVKERLRRIHANGRPANQHDAFLLAQGVSESEHFEVLKKDTRILNFIKGPMLGGYSPSESEIAEFYERNKIRFRRANAADVNYFFMKKDGKTPVSVKRKEALGSILKELRSHPEKFEEIAKKYTEDPDGKLRFTVKVGDGGKIPADKILSLAVGDVSDLIETDQGFYIAKSLAKSDVKLMALDEARPEIIKLLTNNKGKEEVLKKRVKELWKKYDVVLLYEKVL